jgi:hypothetical protein
MLTLIGPALYQEDLALAYKWLEDNPVYWQRRAKALHPGRKIILETNTTILGIMKLFFLQVLMFLRQATH